MVTCTIDLGKFDSVCCFFDPASQKHQFKTIATRRSHIEHLLSSRPDIDLIVMEACGPSGWINDICQDRQVKTLVCSTNEKAWNWKATKRETDRDDALKLAEMSLLRRLVPVHVPKPDIREQRAFIKYRKSVDKDINRLKNSIRSLFANRGIEIDTGERAWNTGPVHINSCRKPIEDCTRDELWRGQLDMQLSRLDDVTRKLESLEAKLDEFAAEHPNIVRLMTIPGVGRKTAEAIVAAIDDPHRFKNAKHLSSYLGLTPKQHQSGEIDRNGRISKRGSKLLRTMLLQCAWCSLRYNKWSKKTYDRITGGSKTRRKKAGIALARKLGVIAWAMMRDQTNWDASKLLPQAEAKDNGKLKIKRKPPKPPGPVYSDESSGVAHRKANLTTKPQRQTRTGNRRTQTVQLK
ncbi:Transposase IS116/IS110/IS902 family protein [Rubripirellula amarantea]|uniref:Transposase IS116/IS110/IS902 family protein n=1 Tax=Rubripirellula amarantea TaxID=2527999 RepID=A0A5C5WB87_9BACT|nr:IS110 family transposase [Rubripirellula amarantea]TWT47940.1 Transposase IS116/IS110/IS902 family protein [Rubripirellula amarantea]